jgi:uncharacterized protein YjbI with pentapeptide repeats
MPGRACGQLSRCEQLADQDAAAVGVLPVLDEPDEDLFDAEPDFAEPDFAEPDWVRPDWVDSDLVESDLLDSDLLDSDLLDSDCVESDLAGSDLVESDFDSFLPSPDDSTGSDRLSVR